MSHRPRPVLWLLLKGLIRQTISLASVPISMPFPSRKKTGAPYASEKEGTMHACGHDTHITILLGTAKVLAAMKDELTVTVRFLFQPAEEEIANSRCHIYEG